MIVSFLSYGIIAVIPAKDELNLAYSYAVLIALSLVVMFVIFRNYKKNAVE